MSQYQHDRPAEVAPLCGNCGATLSPRDNNQWFCPSCIEYGRYLGIVQPDRPDHPQFYRDLDDGIRRARELLVGENVEYSPYGSPELEHIGRITKIEEIGDSAETLTVFIERERNFPFDRTVNQIAFDMFRDLLHEVNPPAHNDIIEKDSTELVIV